MPRTARHRRPHQIDLAALAPHGLVRAATLTAAGIAPSTIQRQVRSGIWRRVGRGLLRVWHDVDADQVLHAALLLGGPDSVITGVHALHRHGLVRTPIAGPVRVLIDTDRRRSSGGPIVFERTERLPEPVIRAQVAIAPLDRAVIDTARHLDRRDPVRAVLAEAVQRRRTTVERLHTELREGCQRGTALPREVLGSIEAGVRSAGEGWAFDLHRTSGLPPILWNARVHRADGALLAEADGFFDDVALAWEVDSAEFHFSPADWEATLRRRADMTNAGVVVVHHSPAMLRREPGRVIDDLWGGLRLAASRPRPDVHVR